MGWWWRGRHRRDAFTRGAFYANFSDKADVFLTLLEEARDADMKRAADVVGQAPDDAKLDVFQGWYDALSQSTTWDLAYAEFWPQATHDPALRSRVAARQSRTRMTIATMIASYCAAADLALPMPVDDVATIMLALADGFAAQRHLDPDSLSEDAFTTAVTLVWTGMLESGAPPSR